MFLGLWRFLLLLLLLLAKYLNTTNTGEEKWNLHFVLKYNLIFIDSLRKFHIVYTTLDRTEIEWSPIRFLHKIDLNLSFLTGTRGRTQVPVNFESKRTHKHMYWTTWFWEHVNDLSYIWMIFVNVRSFLMKLICRYLRDRTVHLWKTTFVVYTQHL